MLSVEEFRKPLGPGYKAGQITCLDLRTGVFFGMGASPLLNIKFSTHYLGWYTQGFNGRVDNCDVSEGVKRYRFINYQLLVRNGNIIIKSTLPHAELPWYFSNSWESWMLIKFSYLQSFLDAIHLQWKVELYVQMEGIRKVTMQQFSMKRFRMHQNKKTIMNSLWAN